MDSSMVVSPGSFHSDQPSLAGASAHSSLFLPPHTSSPSVESSWWDSYQTASRIRSASTDRSRKRQRIDCTTHNTHQDTDEPNTPWSGARSPSPLVNTRYKIAGGIDTPITAHYEDNDFEQDSQVDHRRNRFTSQSQPSDSYFPHTPAEASPERDGHSRPLATPDRLRLGQVVWTLTSGVAAGFFSFCWNTAFRGFQAGGGQKYEIQPDTPKELGESTWGDLEDKHDPFNAKHWGRAVPGQFVEDHPPQPETYDLQPTPTRPALATRNDSWVMVTPFEEPEQSPTRKKARPATLEQRRPTSRSSIAARPRLTPSRPSLTNASYASPRATPEHVSSRPQSSEGHRRSRSSIASPRLPRQSVAKPASPEVMRLEKKIRKTERVQDESMQRLNQQMQDMIRQGKQALHTKIEIVDGDGGALEMEDEGYAEGDYDAGGKSEIYGRKW